MPAVARVRHLRAALSGRARTRGARGHGGRVRAGVHLLVRRRWRVLRALTPSAVAIPFYMLSGHHTTIPSGVPVTQWFPCVGRRWRWRAAGWDGRLTRAHRLSVHVGGAPVGDRRRPHSMLRRRSGRRRHAVASSGRIMGVHAWVNRATHLVKRGRLLLRSRMMQKQALPSGSARPLTGRSVRTGRLTTMQRRAIDVHRCQRMDRWVTAFVKYDWRRRAAAERSRRRASRSLRLRRHRQREFTRGSPRVRTEDGLRTRTDTWLQQHRRA